MVFADAPIRRKLMAMILLTSGAVLLFTCASFFAYELLTFRQSTIRHLTTLAEIIADNSTAALAFDNPDDAREILDALKAEPHIVAAGLYDLGGRLFAKYPENTPDEIFPAAPERLGFHFERPHLIGFQPVVQGRNNSLGMLYLKSDLGAIYEQLRLYGVIAALVIAGSFLVAYLISRTLQRQISQPILALAGTARVISDRRDYSVRALDAGGGELSLLTRAFNHMLGEIQQQHLALRDSEGRLRAVLNSALTAVIVIDSDGRIIDWNARAEAMFGWQHGEAIGLELASTIIPPRFREAHRRGLQRYAASGEGPVVNRLIEMSALRRDGSEFPVELSISPMSAGDAVTFCGFVTDLTERKQSEQKLQSQLGRLQLLSQITRAVGERQDLRSVFQVAIRSLEESLPIDFGCVCLHDAAAKTLIVTCVGAKSAVLAAELAMLEHTRIALDQNGLARCVRGELIHEPDIAEASFPFPQRLARGGLRSLVVAPLLAESRVFGVLVAARRASASFSSGDCEFLRQLSEHVALAAHQAQLYGALQQAYDDLRQSQQSVMQQERLRALGQMASGIAHDINNAISPVALYTESLLEREANLSARARDYLTTIQRAIDDVAQTVARMREFYRPREPQLVLARVDVNRIVQQVIDLTRVRWRDVPQEQGVVIDLQTELAADLPVIMGAEAEIRDALTNLIFNAVDAMPEGGTLTLRTSAVSSAQQAVDESGQNVCLEVCDSGVGMDEETRRKCLEPFFTTKGERGTGLGLAMVFGMARRHSADLEIASAPGEGTIVRLIFPVSIAAPASVVRSPTPAVSERLLRILIVDDDPLLIRSLRDILEGDGHLVSACEGGQAGIDAFLAAQRRSEPFAVVITDLGMPYVDGRKVAAAIRAASPATPIILLTGWGQRLLAENDIPPNVDRVMSKPPKLHELRSALAELTAKSAPT